MIQRNTIQKSLAMETACKLDHPTADEIYNSIVEEHPTVSRATVYRNLNQLAESGKLLKVNVPDAADCYDKTLQNHYHIRCRLCGRVSDVDYPYQAGIERSIINTNGFIIEQHDIIFRGVCAACRNGAQTGR